MTWWERKGNGMYRYETFLKDARVKADPATVWALLWCAFLAVVFVAAVVIPVIRQAVTK